MYYVEVKLGAINAFQTHVLAPGDAQSVHETDPVGKHSSNYVAKTAVKSIPSWLIMLCFFSSTSVLWPCCLFAVIPISDAL